MLKDFTVVLIIAALASAGPMSRRLDGKIVGGEPTTIETAPHQVALQHIRYDFRSHVCGGSIISANWVLTAAQCVPTDPTKLQDYEILAGTADRSRENGGSVHKVVDAIRHPEYYANKWGSLVNDVALIRVREPFQFDDTRKAIPLFAHNEEARAGTATFITGWGSTGHSKPQILNIVSVPIISKSSCSKLYENYGGLPDGEICAAYPEGGKGACQGDSGGPLTIDGRLAGIVSWGHGCAVAGNPGVYTEVAYYREWIKENSNI